MAIRHYVKDTGENSSGSGFPSSLIPALRNIGILHYKKAKLCKHLEHSVHTSEMLLELQALYCDYCGEKVCSVPG